MDVESVLEQIVSEGLDEFVTDNKFQSWLIEVLVENQVPKMVATVFVKRLSPFVAKGVSGIKNKWGQSRF